MIKKIKNKKVLVYCKLSSLNINSTSWSLMSFFSGPKKKMLRLIYSELQLRKEKRKKKKEKKKSEYPSHIGSRTSEHKE